MKEYNLYITEKNNSMFLILEYLIIFYCIPLLFTFLVRTTPLPLIILGGILGFYFLKKDDNFDIKHLYKIPLKPSVLIRIILQFILFSILLYYLIITYFPNYLFYFLKKDIILWLKIVLIYTFVAVYPQEIIYRAFIFNRYRKIINNEKNLVHISSFAFAFGHLIYLNPFSVILSLIGGYIFSFTYLNTKSVFLVYIEHLLYGLLLYTIGFGNFFYSGIL
ncbi:MAG: CPBP family intramembrane metalloprotease [Deferribacterales bacterium]